MTWVSELIDDESVFPSLLNKPFPQNFKATCSDIIRRLFRVYAHIYIDHIQHIRNPRLDEEAHLNTSFRHFILFAQEFQVFILSQSLPNHFLPVDSPKRARPASEDHRSAYQTLKKPSTRLVCFLLISEHLQLPSSSSFFYSEQRYTSSKEILILKSEYYIQCVRSLVLSNPVLLIQIS